MSPASLVVSDTELKLPFPAVSVAEGSSLLTDLRGSGCCCGPPPPCETPCTAGGCEYCLGDTLTVFNAEYTKESWGPSAGGRSLPPCNNQQNACPGKPQNCVPLDETASYDGVSTFRQVETWTTTSNHQMQNLTIGCGVWGDLSEPETLTYRIRRSGRLDSIFNGCRVLTPPSDTSQTVPFELHRCGGGGWSLETSTGAQWSFCDGGVCGGPPNCDSRNCTGDRVLNDLLCALRPVDCMAADISADSGCVQNIGNNALTCTWTRSALRLIYAITRLGQ